MKPFYFRPNGLKFITVSKADAKVDGQFCVCAACGMLWSTVTPKDIEEIVERSGTARLKARLKA